MKLNELLGRNKKPEATPTPKVAEVKRPKSPLEIALENKPAVQPTPQPQMQPASQPAKTPTLQDLANTEVSVGSPAPEDATAEESTIYAQFQAARAKLEAAFNDAEITPALTELHMMIQSNKFLQDNLLPQDIGLMVRALRKSAGVTIEKKQERAAKKTKNAELKAGVADDLADFAF